MVAIVDAQESADYFKYQNDECIKTLLGKSVIESSAQCLFCKEDFSFHVCQGESLVLTTGHNCANNSFDFSGNDAPNKHICETLRKSRIYSLQQIIMIWTLSSFVEISEMDTESAVLLMDWMWRLGMESLIREIDFKGKLKVKHIFYDDTIRRDS